MDGKPLDKSSSPSEQMIVQKSTSDYNLGPITELGLTLKLPPKCTQSKQNNISGAGAGAGANAGANAGSAEEVVLANKDPLSELVWSPDKGLSLKCADFNPAEKKVFLWGTVLSSPQSITIKKEYDVEPLAGGNMNSSEIVHHLGCHVSDGVTLMGSPSSTKTVIGLEHKLGYGLDMSNTAKEEPLFLNLNDDDDHSDKKGKRICFPTNLQSTETSRTRRKQDSSNPEKASSQGLDIPNDSSSTKFKENKIHSVCISPKSKNSGKALGSHLFEVNADFDCGKTTCSNPEKASVQGLDKPSGSSSTKLKLYSERMSSETRDSVKAASSDPSQGNRNLDGRSSHSAERACKPPDTTSSYKQCKLPDTLFQNLKFVSSYHEGMASVIQGAMRKATTSSSKLLLEKGDSTSKNEIKSLNSESASVEVAITSHPVDEAKQNQCQTGVRRENEVDLFESSPNILRNPLCPKKKGKALCNAEDSAQNPKDDDSYDSVESCNNSTSLILARKRPWNFDEHLVIANKKMKEQPHESPHCTSAQRHGSSFMNWISNMVKGSSKSNLKETTLLDLVTIPTHEHRSDGQHSTLQESDHQSAYTGTGFGTVFKALYRSGVHASHRGKPNVDYELGEGSKQYELTNNKSDNSNSNSNSNIPVTCCKEIIKFGNEAVISSENLVMCGDGGITSSPPTIPLANNSIVQEEQKTCMVGNKNLLKIQGDHGQGGKITTSPSSQNNLDFPSQDEETHKLGFSAPKESSSFVIKRTHTVGNLWITRFHPKVSSLMIDSSQCEQNVGVAVKGSTDCIRILSPQNRVLQFKDQSSCEDPQELSSRDHLDVVNERVQDYVVKNDGSFGSIRDTEHTDQKFKSTSNSEAMACVFARRLDALRHIPSKVDASTSHASEVEANTSHASATCKFCGIEGHKLQECLKVTESELNELLKNIDSYNGAEDSSCLCIRCFQLNHWAIACPNISSRKRFHSDGSSLLDLKNLGKRLQTPRRDEITEEINPLDNTVCGGAVSDSMKRRVGKEFRAGADVNRKGNNVAILSMTYPDSKLIKKDLIGNDSCGRNTMKKASSEFIGNGKQTRTSSSAANVSKEYQITAFYNFVNRQIPEIPRGTFEAIKKLRLSRTDICKWSRSPVALFPLEGFFIRPRLRKWEKELGSTGYSVARINGGLRERSSGSSKVVLSVMIGGFKCIVENRFISNHDFLEDELLTWWRATLKAGGNLPSEKDLDLKLKERKSLGF